MDKLAFDTEPRGRRLIELLRKRGRTGWTKLERSAPAMREGRAEPPFAVLMAGYVVDFHHRDVCSRCRPDGSCPRPGPPADARNDDGGRCSDGKFVGTAAVAR
ncbi:hypothetical protein GA0070560_102198 [Micromonospora halophytica]|uniref:Uncharacterized protein n=2 Tax=Micromonospora halophytica TaxID=47864 RepID=A0A1C5GXX6_9ACTN|nr:hypothetical protein GA0070560_102198 [Micromonospora halophytica]